MTFKITLILGFSILVSRDFNEDFFSANKLYINNEFSKSVAIYEDLIYQGLNNHILYYNLGNAYYRDNQIGKSIWAYKKAYFISPRNKNIVFNLELVRNKVLRPLSKQDKSLLNHYLSSFTKIEYIFFCSIVFFIFCLLILFKNLINSYYYKPLFILISLVLLINICSLSFLIVLRNEDLGVIIKNNTNIFSGPHEENYNIILEANEGYEFKIVNITNNWLEVSFNNGIQGWVKLNSIKKL